MMVVVTVVMAGEGTAGVTDILVVVMLVLVFMVMLMLVVMVVVVVTAAAVVVVVLDAVLVSDLGHQLVGQRVTAGHGLHDLGAGELIPGSGEDGGLLVVLPQQLHGGIQLGGVHALGAGEDDGAGVLHLVVIEFAEVLHIDTGLGGVHHGDKAAQMHLVAGLVLYPLHSGDDVGQLAHAGGLDDDAVRGILIQNLAQGRPEVTYQGAADAAGVHLGDLYAGVFQKTAVNADLAEFVFDQHHFFALKGLLKQLLDQSGFAGPEKAGNNIDFCHIIRSFQI